MEEISEIQKVGRRLDSLKNHIREKSPKEVWIIDKIHILFVKLISTGIEKRIELETIRELNDLVDSFEFRFGQMFEQKINTKTRLLIREAIVNLLEEDSKFSEGDAVTTKEGDKGVVTFGKHPFYAVKLDNTGTTHSYHFSDLELDPTASPEGMDFGKYDTTEPEQPQEPELREIKVNNPIKKDEILKLPYVDEGGDNYLSALINEVLVKWQKKYPKYNWKEIVSEMSDKDIMECYQDMKLAQNYKRDIDIDDSIFNKTLNKILNRQDEQPLQESSPQDIVHLDGLLTVQDNLNVTDVMSDIRSITGITIVKPIDIPGESHKNKLKIKIDPFPFSNKDPEFIRQQIKILIRKIPGVREFWSGKIIEPLSERKYKIKDPK